MKTAADILVEMADTYRERNKVYGDNFLNVGKVMEVLHGPNSAAPASGLIKTADDFNKWHLYELLVVKLTRFANSGLTHRDSIRDLCVYGAMVEALLAPEEPDSVPASSVVDLHPGERGLYQPLAVDDVSYTRTTVTDVMGRNDRKGE